MYAVHIERMSQNHLVNEQAHMVYICRTWLQIYFSHMDERLTQ